HFADVLGVYDELLAFFVRGLKADFVEHALHDGMEAAGADVFSAFVHAEREVRDFFERVGGEFEFHALGFQQGGVLLGERRLGLGEDLDEVIHGERLQLDPDGEAALKFGNEIAGLGDVKRPGGDEQDVIGAHHAVARIHGGAFDDGKDVALYTFAGDVGAVTAFASGDLVDLVEEDDAGVFHAIDGHAGNLIHVDKALLFFLDEVLEGLVDLHFPLFSFLPEDVGQHVFDVDVHLFDALVGDDFEGRERTFAHVDFDHAVVKLALA